MRVKISDLKKFGAQGQDVEFEGQMTFDDLSVADPVRIQVHLAQAGDRIQVKGTVATGIVRACSRCACEFVAPITTPVEEYFIPAGSPEAQFQEELCAEEMNVFTYDENYIELGEVIRQNLIAAIPMRSLCREDCKGICPGCGQDLNLGPCRCEPGSVQPGWSA